LTAANLLFSIAYILDKKGEIREASRQYRKALQVYEKNGYQGKEVSIARSAIERIGP